MHPYEELDIPKYKIKILLRIDNHILLYATNGAMILKMHFGTHVDIMNAFSVFIIFHFRSD